MNNYSMDNLQAERLKHFPNVNSLLKISLGLVLFTVISTAFVYAETISVDVDGNTFDVEYTATGLTITGIESDTDFISLILNVDIFASSGILDITFDRAFFDSTFEGLDDEFIILADGDEPNFTETETTDESRTLSINLPAGTEEVEIIGSVFGDGSSMEEDTAEEEAAAKAAEEEAAAKAAEEEAAAKAAAEKAAMEAEEKQKTQCGPGTILKDGACVLDERCGPGTILEDGVCVLVETPTGTSTSSINIPVSDGKEMVIGVIAAFIIAGAIGIVLGLIAKAGKRRD